MFVMESVDDLWDHIAYVLAYAPNDFPYRDFLPADQQMNLDRAFEQLRQGIEIAYPEQKMSAKRSVLGQLLDDAYSAYRNNEPIKAGHLINQFQDGIFKSA